MNYKAIIHDLSTGRFLVRCNVEAANLLAAERTAISRTALALRVHPRDVDVRHLHECMSQARVNVTAGRT
jgi:hypothetical protein